ncbi:MAG: hypothetical protein A2Y03_00090 [Omnitrophica WOR_2 bacterium GWF2_38_59]|nr:MAG: hypothetical protein A2Y03_00090 [Omnitrophica WOR_2 bacterium GWF2_38_59]OGX49934.1 MAG: hypothetical protein A2243_11365 [Omnitrophica WOR_2 bacterium RIFOXYA2_FULL_38_17]OGX53702.1 MAG: hypothetical protein A2267_10170 [Omnitrophica WOR_2 bacterium RIFOXYA12_FULL_38_10]OGX56553.1 MAG: hypothetical protein A2306_07030 [Omnitrophica WOR_2 bacterium RIFOXYB2_FULL_38_16]OGX58130.1 MAG: hypothetical protein A2447_01455 [Omnitrophica WOR_2 bacterium RIFOXYC2_FULL_38_12]HBG61181.1 potassiu
MHKKFVLNIVSRVQMIVCMIMTIPLLWAIADDPHSKETISFIVTILLGLFVSCIVFWNVRMDTEDYERLNAKDGLAIVGLSWVCLSAFGALPLYLSHVVSNYTDAFFEIVSGFTTTGATIFIDVEALPRGILFWRSLTHWLGGMGIIVLYLTLLPVVSKNDFQLFKAESPGITVERVEPRIKETAKMLWTVYVLLSVVETILLMLGKMPFFDALCHTFGTMATGGFSTKNASIGAYGPYIQWVITFFMFLAGVNFMLHYQALRGKIGQYFRNEEFKWYLFLAVVSIFIFTVVLHLNSIVSSPLRTAAFQTFSVMTTTGYVTADFDIWPQALRFILIVLMFIGGCGGSTGGGMKVIRFFLSLKIALRSIMQALFPNAVLPVRFNKAPQADRIVSSVLSFFVIYIALFFLGTIVMTITERCDLVTAFSASIACLSNIGPGLGKVGAVGNYAWISNPGKWFLSFLMLAGRLELYSILVLFIPSTWHK